MGKIGVRSIAWCNSMEGCLMYRGRGCILYRNGLFSRSRGVLGGLFRGRVWYIGEECGVYMSKVKIIKD